jgi:hypothetical protein
LYTTPLTFNGGSLSIQKNMVQTPVMVAHLELLDDDPLLDLAFETVERDALAALIT